MPPAILVEPAAPGILLPPTQDELPCDDGMPMETERHKLQMDLLIYPLKPWLNRYPEGGYVGGNMFVYFSLEQVRQQDFRVRTCLWRSRFPGGSARAGWCGKKARVPTW